MLFHVPSGCGLLKFIISNFLCFYDNMSNYIANTVLINWTFIKFFVKNAFVFLVILQIVDVPNNVARTVS